MIENIKYYIGSGTDPYFNLATEEYLFDNVDDRTLILYLWQNQNTVVYGRNQNPWTECNIELLKADGGFPARRLSGGGAVFHDLGNLNFTFISKTENYDLDKNMEIIKEACRLAGIETYLSGRNDILTDGKKFSGNAFYNSKGNSYHHGTILISASKEKMTKYLTPSKAKLESKGVKSVKSRVVNLVDINPDLTVEKMKAYMLFAFESVFNTKASPLTIEDNQTVLKLAERNKSWDFLYGKTFPFTASFSGRFNWGQIDILLIVEKAIIKDVKVYTDSMDYTISDRVETALSGIPYDTESIKNAIENSLPEDLVKDLLNLII